MDHCTVNTESTVPPLAINQDSGLSQIKDPCTSQQPTADWACAPTTKFCTTSVENFINNFQGDKQKVCMHPQHQKFPKLRFIRQHLQLSYIIYVCMEKFNCQLLQNLNCKDQLVAYSASSLERSRKQSLYAGLIIDACLLTLESSLLQYTPCPNNQLQFQNKLVLSLLKFSSRLPNFQFVADG